MTPGSEPREPASEQPQPGDVSGPPFVAGAPPFVAGAPPLVAGAPPSVLDEARQAWSGWVFSGALPPKAGSIVIPGTPP